MVPGLIFGTSFMGPWCSIFFSKARGGVTFIPYSDFEVFYESGANPIFLKLYQKQHIRKRSYNWISGAISDALGIAARLLVF